MYMLWFVRKMRLRHMCTFASENLTVKGLTKTKTKTKSKSTSLLKLKLKLKVNQHLY